MSGRLGMDVLKRFNTVLDFRNDVAYLSASSLYGDPYRFGRDDGRRKVALAAAAVLLAGAGVLWYRRRAAAQPR